MSIGSPGESTALPFTPSASKPAILVVDEDPAFQLGLKTFLREYVGFSEVHVASSGAEALDKIESEPAIELVTLDYRMPGMNGIEMLEELSRSLPRPLSVTMITGYPSEELEEEFRSFHSPRLLTDYFLTKPVEFERLEPVILRAYEDLEKAKTPPEPDPVPEQEAAPESAPLEGEHVAGSGPIHELIDRQNQKLDDIERRIVQLRHRWRMDFWSLVGVGALAWASVKFGWIDALKPVWETVKTSVVTEVERLTQGAAEPDASGGAVVGEPSPAQQPTPEAHETPEKKPDSGLFPEDVVPDGKDNPILVPELEVPPTPPERPDPDSGRPL